MQLRNIHIALPAYSGQVCVDNMQSLLAEMLHAAGKGYCFHIDPICGGSDIPALRNAFLSRFLCGDYYRSVHIDTDLAWETGAITSLIDRDVDYVVGGYRCRSDPEKYRIHLLPGPLRKKDPATGENVWDEDPRGLLEIKCAPGGLTCLSRGMVERMREAYPTLKYQDAMSPDGYSWGLFDNFHRDELRWSEDLAFGLRWRDCGGKIWVDTNLTTHHIGPKTFTGNLEKHLIEVAEKVKAEKWKVAA